MYYVTVASLGLVSPDAATDGVTLFFLKNCRPFLVIAVWKVMTLFLPYDIPPLYTVLSKFSHILCHSGITPWRVSPGVVRPYP